MKYLLPLIICMAGCLFPDGMRGRECKTDMTCEYGLVCLVWRGAGMFDQTECVEARTIHIIETIKTTEHTFVPANTCKQ